MSIVVGMILWGTDVDKVLLKSLFLGVVAFLVVVLPGIVIQLIPDPYREVVDRGFYWFCWVFGISFFCYWVTRD